VVIKKADAFAQVLVDADITPTFKHFPGFDSSVAGQNTDLAKVTLSTNLGNLESKNIAPYKALLAKYPDSHLMMSNLFTALDPGNMASTSKATVDYVRGTLGFGGVIMTDSLTGPAGYLWPTAFLRMPPPRNTKRKLKIG
jgi:beta-N-acetylhexosaminidase